MSRERKVRETNKGDLRVAFVLFANIKFFAGCVGLHTTPVGVGLLAMVFNGNA